MSYFVRLLVAFIAVLGFGILWSFLVRISGLDMGGITTAVGLFTAILIGRYIIYEL